MTLQNTVRMQCLKNGETYEEFARKLGLSRMQLYNKCRGVSRFSLSQAISVSNALGISVEQLAAEIPKHS